MLENWTHSHFENLGFKAQICKNQTKNVQNLNNFLQFGLFKFRFQTPEIFCKRNFFLRILDPVQIPNPLELGQNFNIREPNMFSYQTFTV